MKAETSDTPETRHTDDRQPADGRWRLLLAYVLVTVAFWVLVFGPGGGGTNTLEMKGQAAALNALLFLPVVFRKRWALIGLLIEAVFVGGLVVSVGVPPFGDSFGLLVLGPFAQICLLTRLDQTDAAALRPTAAL